MEGALKVSRPKKYTLKVEEAVIKIILKNLTTQELSTQKIANIISPLVKEGVLACSIY